MKNIVIIAGHKGFIGSNLYRYLSRVFEVVVIGRDYETSLNEEIISIEELRFYLESKDCNVIFINCITKYVRVGDSYIINDLVYSNITYPASILHRLSEIKRFKIINFESFFQYDELGSFVNSVYSQSKNIFRQFLEDNNFCFHNIVLYDTFGVGDTRNKLLPLLKKSIYSHDSISINNLRVNLALTDVNLINKCIEFLINNFDLYPTGSKFGVHHGIVISIEELLNIALEYGEFDVKANSGPVIIPKLLPLPLGFTGDSNLTQAIKRYFENV